MKKIVVLIAVVLGMAALLSAQRLPIPLETPRDRTSWPPTVLHGTAADPVMREIANRNPKMQAVFAKMEAAKVAKGYTGKTTWVIGRRGSPKRLNLMAMLMPTLHAQAESSGEGFVAFGQWNAPDAPTWAGTIYGEEYTSGKGLWRLSAMEFDDSNLEEDTIWAETYGAGASNYVWDAPIGFSGSASCPTFTRVGGARMLGCGCAGCSWSWNVQQQNACWNNDFLRCVARRSPNVGRCIPRQIYGVLLRPCVIATGFYDVISCHSEALKVRWSQCGVCG